MATFGEANQAKLSLKMKLSNYSWYKSITVIADGHDYSLVVAVNQVNNSIRKIVPAVYSNIAVKVDLV